MASNSYRIIKSDTRKYEKRRLYMRQSNYLISNEPYQSSKCYRIDLNFLADQNKSLIDIFLTFFDSIHEIKDITSTRTHTATLRYNQIFTLMVKNYFLCDLFLPKVVKASEEDRMAHFQIIGFSNIQYLDQLSLNTQIRQLCEITKAEMQGKFKAKLEEALMESKQEEEQKNSLKLDIINSILRQQRQKTIQYIMAIQDPSIKNIYLPKEMKDVERLYITKVINALLSFRFTKNLYRSLKFADFIQKKYKGFYNLNYFKQHGYNIRQRRQNKFIMKRYTNNDNEYLTNLYSLVKIRNQEENYDCQMFQTTKQFLKELISHEKMTKSAYPMLSPHSIIFNQISLKVQLSYQNPLLQALGLLSKPTNTENAVCFMATPVPYDTYANPAELQNPQLQTNHLIGINQILKEHYRIPALNKNSDLALEKGQAGQASQSWRFMMTAHFLMHGKEYYRTAGATTFKRLPDFKDFVKQEEQKLKSPQNKGYYTSIFGQNFMRFVRHNSHEKQYDPSLYFFENLFNASQDSDSVIQQFGQIKINRYLKLFAHNIRQLLIITSSQLFSNVYNTIHHLLRFYLGIFLQISQIMTVSHYFNKNQEIGVKLFEELAAKASKETSKKSSYIELSYEKFKEYKRRHNVRSEGQYTYLKERYKEQYEGIEDFYQFHKSLKAKVSQISGQSSNERLDIDLQSKKEALVSQLGTCLLDKLSKIRPTISALIYHQFVLPKQPATASQKLSYLTTKLELLAVLVLGLSHQNFITVESIIMPALRANQAIQHNSLPNSISDEQYGEQRELCDYCLQIMKEQTLQLGLGFQKNGGLRAGKQHGKVDEKGHSKDSSQNN